MVYIYVLKLEKNKYYVGKTSNPKFRLESHFNFQGSEWTKKYKPLQLEELIPNCDEYDEDKYTRIYMDRYGIDSVRGGSFSSIELCDEEIALLTKMERSVKNSCFKCGKTGHFAKECKEERKEQRKEQRKEEDYEFIVCCFRCGREGHYANSCYAKTDFNGDEI